MRSRSVVVASVVLGAAGVAAVVAAPAAVAAPATACSQIQSTLSSIQQSLPAAASNPSQFASKIASFSSQLESEAASAPSSVQAAVNSFVGQLKAAASGNINISALTSDAKAIGTACAATTSTVTSAKVPTAAPNTGTGSTAGLQHVDLIAGGAAAVLVGMGAVGVALRRRRLQGTAS
jgi:hypothetical protein